MPVLAILADWDDGRMMHDGNGTGWWAVALVMLVVVVAAVVLVVWFATRADRPQAAPPPADANLGAKQILGERLARGEIEPAEYQERLTHLR